MPRGYYWEMTYDPDGNPPSRESHLSDLKSITGHCDCKIVSEGGKFVQVKAKANDPDKRFEGCDFSLVIKDSAVTNWTFYRCRFDGSTWENVKFSNCEFERCHFSRTTFIRCTFVDSCRFKNNSASAQLLRLEETAISATRFLGGLQTNLQFIDDPTARRYQQHRLIGTRVNIAMMIYNSTRNEANLDFFYEAYKELICCELDQRVEKCRYIRTEGKEQRLQTWAFYLRSFPARAERCIVRTAGYLMDWGKSLRRASVLFASLVAFFGFAYFRLSPHQQGMPVAPDVLSSFVKSLNITLVAGYTAYFSTKETVAVQLLMTINLVAGLFWYSLVIPVLTRKVLR